MCQDDEDSAYYIKSWRYVRVSGGQILPGAPTNPPDCMSKDTYEKQYHSLEALWLDE